MFRRINVVHCGASLLMLMAFSALSCKDENLISPEYLTGKWIVLSAYRNEKLTNTLEGAFFYFDGKIMTSNFLGYEQQAVYQLENNRVRFTKGMDYTFLLKKKGVGQLELKVEIQKTPFTFVLKKE